ncbi:MAG: hypothetical protein JKX91_05520 [Rhizobiaceae bacterium]|nr:hypothetical protein [Rhizobiaceae bacterium]
MKIFKFVVVTLLIFALVIVGWYGLRYFFDPGGISLEKGAICTTNESEDELVFSVESIPGSKIIAFLAKGEKLCAPSSTPNPHGIIKAGEDEDHLECVVRVATPEEIIFLSRYFGEGKCDWGKTTR